MVKNLLEMILTGKSSQAMDLFNEIVMEKCGDKLELRKKQIVKEIYDGQPREVELTEEQIDSLVEDFEKLSEEELNELSKKTLSSYITKASSNSVMKGIAYGHGEMKAQEIDKFTNDNSFDRDTRGNLKKQAKVDIQTQNKKWEKLGNRVSGIHTAVKKLAQEEYQLELTEDQLDEISKAVLGSYINKAATDMASSAASQHINSHKMAQSKSVDRMEYFDKKSIDAFANREKRKAGIKKATDKLTKD